MAFILIGPAGGWSLGATFTSAQANAIAADLVNALDKSTANDSLAGVISMLSTAAIMVSTPGAQIIAQVANGITSSTAGGISPGVVNGIQSSTAGGISSQTAQGIIAQVPFGIAANAAQGIYPLVAGGIGDGGVVGGIAPTVAGGISDGGVAGGLGTTVAGGFRLGGGASDFPVFSATRNKARSVILRPNGALASGWGAGAPLPGLVGPGTNTSQFCVLLGSDLHYGATLTTVSVYFTVGGMHAGGLPSLPPNIAVIKYPLSAPGSYVYLSSTTFQGAWATGSIGGGTIPGGGPAWYAGGGVQSFNYVCNQNNVLDTNSAVYMIQLYDESGGSYAASGNSFICANLQFTSIPNMAFD